MSDAGSPTLAGSEDQFWQNLRLTVYTPCDTHESIDNALRAWLHLVACGRDQYLDSEDEVASCSQQLLESPIFVENKDYVRNQIIFSLLQEDELGSLHIISNFLLMDGRLDETTFRRMIDEGCFPRLIELVRGCREADRRLHRLLLELIYEMSRIEQLRPEDLAQVDDGFVFYLCQLIESVSDDVDDPYHYPIIRVLLILNEQYMVASTTAAAKPGNMPLSLTNRVIKILSIHGPVFRTFGENIILLLNRETETSLQLLILKLFYLLFTTKATYEYFYTNDLRVLLDVIIRNLLDLPNELAALRHTYLRVLYPLLAHTQLSQPPHYKRGEIIKVLKLLSGSGNIHFAPADETTIRLVDRVSKVQWLTEEPSSLGASDVARKFLGISLSDTQTASSISVIDVAAVTEKPGVKTPKRRMNTDLDHVEEQEAKELAAAANEDAMEAEQQARTARPLRILPEVPRHRHGLPVIKSVSDVAATLSAGKGAKKQPPKLPPPRRRTRLKSAILDDESEIK